MSHQNPDSQECNANESGKLAGEPRLDAAGVLYVLGGIPALAAFFVIYFFLVRHGVFPG